MPTAVASFNYHQEYFAREGDNNPYCMAVVAPKLRKFRKSFANRLKDQALAEQGS